MKPEERELAEYRLACADESIEAAGVLIERNLLASAVNRIYYGCFYAVSSLLYTAGLSSSKHSGVIALFEQHFVKTAIVPVEQGRFFRSMFKRRMRGDYDDFVVFERAEVEALLAEAHQFVQAISRKTLERI